MAIVRKSRKKKTPESEVSAESQEESIFPSEGEEPDSSDSEEGEGENSPGENADSDVEPASEAGHGESKTVVVRTRPRRAPYKETRSQHEPADGSPADHANRDWSTGGRRMGPPRGEPRHAPSRWQEPAAHGPANGNSGEGKAFPFRETAPVATPLPALPRLPSMPDIYGRPEPRLDQDN